jgi:uncharacterized protein with LGFP repeats
MTAITDKHMELGSIAGLLGVPTTIEAACADGAGRFQEFQGGSIYWHPDVGAFEVHGLIRDKWRALGAEAGSAGYPTTDERFTADGVGRVSRFTGGIVYWHPATGAWKVHGDIIAKYVSLGGPGSPLGYPTSDEQVAPDGIARFSTFEHGAIYWTSATGAREVHGLIYAKWRTLGLGASTLGYPVTDEQPDAVSGGRVSRFQHGRIVWTSSTGAKALP